MTAAQVSKADGSEATALPVLQDVNFDWVRRLRDVWHDDSAHVPEINREAFEGVLKAFAGAGQQLGRVMVGPAGSGKTHLLGALRAVIVERGWFVLVDMTDVRDFWETVLQGYLESLREPLQDGLTQFQKLLHEVLEHLAERSAGRVHYAGVTQRLRTAPLPEIVRLAQVAIGKGVAPLYPAHAREFQDVLRALLLLNADDFDVSNLGYTWLLGLELSDAQRRDCGFTSMRRSQKHVVQGLSWLMSLTRPTLLALDQMDAIVSQHAAASQAGESEDQAAARAILHGIGNGLLGLHDTLQRSLTVLSCLTSTWDVLRLQTTEAVAARFDRNLLALSMGSGAFGRRMVEARLAAAYERHAFRPPYPSWPFRPEAFEDAAGLRPPREILIDCAAHRDQCIVLGGVHELLRFGSAAESPGSRAADAVAERFARLLDSVGVEGLISDKGDDERLGRLIANACVCAVSERPPVRERDLLPEVDFPDEQAPALHARLRIVEHDESGHEKHYCFRALNRGNAVAFQNRLRLAMTASGIGADLSFRRLVVVRNVELPQGDKTQTLIRAFTAAGGKLVSCSEEDLRRLIVLEQLCNERPEGLDEWLRRERPASTLSFLRESGFVAETEALSRAVRPASSRSTNGAGAGIPESATAHRAARHAEATLVLGQHIGSPNPEPVGLALPGLTRHVAILGSPGSGKTVLLRRLIEEAALLRVPSIVVDPGHDVARLGDPWPAPPPAWGADDAQKAASYLRDVEVRVWTPGQARGRPLSLPLLPDMQGLEGEECDLAVEMAAAALTPVVAAGQTSGVQRRRGVLVAALKHHAAAGGGGLDALIEVLEALPPEASGADAQAPRLAVEMASLLRAQQQSDPLWKQAGPPLEPGELLGIGAARTRISVINLTGLSSLDAQQSFVNALAMTLFGWICRHPASPEQPLRALLVLEEAKDFVPSRHKTLCKDSLLRLAAQARKYGLGLVFASQEPQSIDHYIVASCATQIYGKAGSAPAIERVQDQLKARGGRGQDIARLTPGQFYASLENAPVPIKIAAPMCLSWHPETALTPEEVLARARQ